MQLEYTIGMELCKTWNYAKNRGRGNPRFSLKGAIRFFGLWFPAISCLLAIVEWHEEIELNVQDGEVGTGFLIVPAAKNQPQKIKAFRGGFKKGFFEGRFVSGRGSRKECTIRGIAGQETCGFQTD